MEISVHNVDFNEDSWKNLPNQTDWKQLYKSVKTFLNLKLSSEQSKEVVNKIDNVIDILVRYGDTYESLVLEIAVVYGVLTNTQFGLKDLNLNLSQYVEEGANALILSKEKGDISSIFENKKMPYLNKIKLAEYICLLQNNKSTINRFRALAEAKQVIETFNGKTHKGLMNMLTELCKN